jgi:glycosyltransferase involved in cell wall biosynthesis
MVTPFFSVCMPPYNRGKTIFRALESIQNQRFRDFEVVIVDNRSTDNAVKEIKRFFQSNLYNENPFKYTFKENSEHLKGTKNWNKPLESAKGNYVAVLEGDDRFLPTHLQEAYNILSKYNDIGIYAVGNQNRPRPITGLISSETYFEYTYKMENVSPPSETIFIRQYNNKQYLYNTRDYNYCPEVELYLEISNDGLDVYHSPKRTVSRNVSLKDRLDWKYLQDKFNLIKKWKNHKWIGNNSFHQALKYESNIAFKKYASAKMRNRSQSEGIWNGLKMEIKDAIPKEYSRLNRKKKVLDSLVKANVMNPYSARYFKKLLRVLNYLYI